jgi:hypothetical protein
MSMGMWLKCRGMDEVSSAGPFRSRPELGTTFMKRGFHQEYVEATANDG